VKPDRFADDRGLNLILLISRYEQGNFLLLRL